MDPKTRRSLKALLKQARLDGAPAFVGIVHKQDGTTHAVLLAEQLFVFKALRRTPQPTLVEFLYLDYFTRFDAVQVIEKFKDPVVGLAVKQLHCKLPVILTEMPLQPKE